MRLLNTISPINRNHPLNKGLVSFWLAHPSYSKTNMWRDLVGGLHGTFNIMGRDSWVGTQGEPSIYGALRFNGGTNRYVNLDKYKSNILEVSSPGITIFTVLKLNTSQTSREIITKAGTGGAPTGFGFGIDDSINNRIKWYTGNGSSGNNITSNSALNVGVWYSVCVTAYYRSWKEIYINGVIDKNFLASGYTLQYGANGSSLGSIGRYAAAGTQHIIADISSLLFYNIPLSPKNIMSLHQSSKQGYKNQLNFINFRTGITSSITNDNIINNIYQRKDFSGDLRGVYRGAARGVV